MAAGGQCICQKGTEIQTVQISIPMYFYNILEQLYNLKGAIENEEKSYLFLHNIAKGAGEDH